MDEVDGASPADCPFCAIANVYTSYPPTSPPRAGSTQIAPTKTDPETFVVLSTSFLVAFLDLAPLTRGHLLLCPRRHRRRLTDVTPAEASELGRYQRLLSKALCRATGVTHWNVVSNNGTRAAQAIDHAHFHFIPRPPLDEKDTAPRTSAGSGSGSSGLNARDSRTHGSLGDRYRRSAIMFGRGQRSELDVEDAWDLAEDLRMALAQVMVEEGSMDTPKWKL